MATLAPSASKGFDDPKADAAAGAGNKDHLVCQTKIHDGYAVGSL
jgi:hypothetical protein